MYSLHRIRSGYWVIRNLYGEQVAVAHSRTHALTLIGMLTR